MKAEHKAILAAAEKDGLLPSEKDAALIVHDMVQATRKQMARFEVGYNKMTEKQQDTVLGELADAYKETALIIARIIAGAGTHTVPMTLKDLKIANGTLTGVVDGSEQYFNELISKVQDKSEVLIVLYEREYADALDNIQSEKDQRALPLEGDDKPKKTRAKPKADGAPVEIPPKTLEQARDFVTIQQTASVAAIQNQFRCGFEKAVAILEALKAEGVVTSSGEEPNTTWSLVRSSSPVVTSKNGKKVELDKETAEVFYATAVKAVIKAVSADDSVLRPIYGDDDNAIEVALMRMEDDGIVSPPSPEGLRDVLTLP